MGRWLVKVFGEQEGRLDGRATFGLARGLVERSGGRAATGTSSTAEAVPAETERAEMCWGPIGGWPH